jgi:hypothetical protein
LDYESDRVIVSRFSRGGTNDKERVRIREICTKPIVPALDNSNIKKLLTTDPGSDKEYDIAEDATSWQDGITSIHRHAVNYDCKSIFLIPGYFDKMDVTSISPNAHFTNSILDHVNVSTSRCFDWQEFVRHFGRDEEITSDHWMEEKLWKSLSPSLLAEVRSDFNELPTLQKGAISLVGLIINRMVQGNQDSCRAMEDYIKTFSIQKFPGEDVSMACLRIHAIANALGKDRLLSDIVHRVLDGFAQASTPAFQHLCHYQVAMLLSSLIKATISQSPLYMQQLNGMLNDLKVRVNLTICLRRTS